LQQVAQAVAVLGLNGLDDRIDLLDVRARWTVVTAAGRGDSHCGQRRK
jgi:hypothetical protein